MKCCCSPHSPRKGNIRSRQQTVSKLPNPNHNPYSNCCAGEVGQTDFDQAILRAVAGVEKKRSVLQGAEKESVAKHECGHALVSTAVATLIPTSPQVSNASCLTCSSCQPCVAIAAFFATGNVNCLIESQHDCLCHHMGPMWPYQDDLEASLGAHSHSQNL